MQLKLLCGSMIVSCYLLACHKSAIEGCEWEENFQADYLGTIPSVSLHTKEQCCKFCLNGFNDTFAAQYQDDVCTCLNKMHKKNDSEGGFYTYITRVPFLLNQSDYECGSYGINTLQIFNFVKSDDEKFVIQTINMDLSSNLSTAILMIAPDNTLLNYDGAFVGVSKDSKGYSGSNILFNQTYNFRIGSVDETTQFAMSYTRTVPRDSNLIVFLKPFKVIRNGRISYANLQFSVYGSWNKDVYINLSNEKFGASADSENLWYKLYFDDRLVIFSKAYASFEGTVSSMNYEIIVEKKLVTFHVPKLGCGTRITLAFSFISRFLNYQKIDSLYEEFTASIYKKDGAKLVEIKSSCVRKFELSKTQQLGRNRRFAADMTSMLHVDDSVLICHWADDRTKNLCGLMNLEGITTFTILSAVFLVPICFDNVTKYFYFEDILGNVVIYDYLNKIEIRTPYKKQTVLQLPSIILPVTKKRSDMPCCGYFATLGSYKSKALVYYRVGFGVVYPTVRYAWPYPTSFVLYF